MNEEILGEIIGGLIVGFLIVMILIIGMVIGEERMKLNYVPEPEQCLSVCTDIFEKAGC